MGKRGENTPQRQRRINYRNSRKKLKELLQENFQEGAQLLTLTYAGRRDPSPAWEEQLLKSWMYQAKRKAGRMRYIRAIDHSQGGPTVFRIIVQLSRSDAQQIANLWMYGPALVEPLKSESLDALAALLMGNEPEQGCRRAPCRRVWTPSLGLLRADHGVSRA